MKQFNFSRLFLVLCMLLCNVFVFADDLITEQVVVTVEEPGTLPGKISEADKNRITDLKIIGELNGTDFRFIREMAGVSYNGNKTIGKLIKLDIEKTKIVYGGDPYYVTSRDYVTYSDCIGDYMFMNCTQLVSVRLPETVKRIEFEAFFGCSSLVDVQFPKELNKIDMYSFKDCINLKEASFYNPQNEMLSLFKTKCSLCKTKCIYFNAPL